MRSQFLSLALAGAVAASVTELTKDTFHDFVKQKDLALVEFYAPWCGHCKALAPEYEEAAKTLTEKDIYLAKVDCTVEQEICQEHGVEGYPTLKVFRGKDTVSPYQGARKSQAIISYMTKQSLPAVSNIDDGASLKDFKASDSVVLVAYFDADDKESNTTFTAAANAMRDNYLFGATNDAELAKEDGVKQPAVVLYKSFDEGKVIYDGKFEKADIEAFAKKASIPLVGEVGPDTYQGYMNAGIPLAYIFAETEEERKKLSGDLKPVAKKYKGKINFATIDAKSFGQHASNLNLEVGKWPAFAIQDTVKNQKFPFDQTKDFTVEAIAEFVDNYDSGEVKPSIKSEPIPEKQDGPVTIVVAHNYRDIVLDDTKDVLIEFYAPWCGHCKALAPNYDILGQLYESHKDQVVIAKVDATANDVPDDIQGFPTIKMYAAGKKEAPTTYSGARTVVDLAKFVRDNGKYKVDVVDQAEEKTGDKADEKADEKTEEKAEAGETAEQKTEKAEKKAEEKAEAHDEL